MLPPDRKRLANLTNSCAPRDRARLSAPRASRSQSRSVSGSPVLLTDFSTLGGYGCQKARQNCGDKAGEIGLVIFRTPPGSVFVETEVQVSRSMEF